MAAHFTRAFSTLLLLAEQVLLQAYGQNRVTEHYLL